MKENLKVMLSSFFVHAREKGKADVMAWNNPENVYTQRTSWGFLVV